MRSYVANEDDFIDRSEVFQSYTADRDARRFEVAKMALADPHRNYHFVLLHLTDMDSQASTFGKSDAWNQHNLNRTVSGSPNDAPWAEFIPNDPVGNDWRANSYKRAIARSGDLVDELLDRCDHCA